MTKILRELETMNKLTVEVQASREKDNTPAALVKAEEIDFNEVAYSWNPNTKKVQWRGDNLPVIWSVFGAANGIYFAYESDDHMAKNLTARDIHGQPQIVSLGDWIFEDSKPNTYKVIPETFQSEGS